MTLEEMGLPSFTGMQKEIEALQEEIRSTNALCVRYAREIVASQAREKILLDALEAMKELVDTDSIKSETEDDEVEYWVPDLQVQHIADEAIEKYNQAKAGSEK